MTTRIDIQPGWDIYSSEGEHIGTIAEVQDAYLLVTKGTFLPKDHYVPFDAVTEVRADQGQVLLNCTKSEFDSMGWDQGPDATTGQATPANAAYDTWAGTDAGTSERADATARSESVDIGETRTIPRYEEELRAEKTSQQTGEVRVTKDVTEEEQSFEVPVMREDVEVRRVAVNRPASESEETFSEGDTIRVPIRGEEVHVTKEPRVVEELEIRKTAREDRQRVGDTVRKEQVNVEQTGDAGRAEGSDVYTDDRELAGAGAGADRFASQRGWDKGSSDDRGGYQPGGGVPDHGDDTQLGGGAAGAVGGAAVGGALGGPPGAVVGGAAGAIGGAAAGDAVDKDEDSDKPNEGNW